MAISDTIETATTQPASASVDGLAATAVSIPDLIAADLHTTARDAINGTNSRGGPKSAWRCLRIARVVPPGGND